MKQREHKILELLTEQQRIEVSSLAEMLSVSQVTIRKDLDALEEKGVIRREHGWAVLRSADDINGRIAYHFETKWAIAQKAASLIQGGETILIESGSCCALFAESLGESGKEITILTNSAFIAGYVRRFSNLQVILLGGQLQKDAQVTVGPLVKACLQDFHVDKMFIGADGFLPDAGFTNNDFLRAQAVRDMAEAASSVTVLTESLKFSKGGTVPLRLGKKLNQVITDGNILPETKELLETQNISLIFI